MSNDCLSNPLEVYFVANGTSGTSGNSAVFSTARRVQYDVPRGRFNIDLDMRARAPDTWKGIITGLRIDPAQTCSSAFDPVRFYDITVQR